MQQLKVEHKKSTNNQKVVSNENKVEEIEKKRQGHARNIALTRNVFRLLNSDTFYVESQTVRGLYYFVRNNFLGTSWCSCPDSSMRQMKCKHIWSIEYSIRLATIKNIDKLPKEAKRDNSPIVKSAWNEDYDF